ncbi:MAG: DUF3397 domain-containing protein [Lactobacillaceae bacterium]|jgi:hypothetical protein|nr:DUF3397 domain-containing protein [Lactobacillaceae bacterium]
MFTLINWPIAVGLTVALWLIVLLLQRTGLRRLLPKKIGPIDIMTPIMWWTIGSVSFQHWQRTGLPELWFFVIMVGLALAIWQGFWLQKFQAKKFWFLWWRIVDLVTIVATIGVLVLALVL